MLLLKQGLALFSVKVHLAAITAFHLKVDNQSVFSHKMVTRFLKGLERVYIKVREIPSWG